jgi:hypothetical protein
MSTLRRLSLIPLSLGFALAISAQELSTQMGKHEHSASSEWKNSPLVEKVRASTWRYRDINVALSEGFVQGTPCVSGPNAGAMGVHFVLPARIGDGKLNAREPESLIYEPLSDGRFRLVGVEFIVIADDWAKQNPDGPTPAVDGHLTNLVPAPNRYGLPSFYELHVWAWQQNPEGNFADWNTVVTCDKQAAPQDK